MHKVWHMIFLPVIAPVMKQLHCTLYLKKKKKVAVVESLT